MSSNNKMPALKFKSDAYPSAWYGRVPKRIRLTETVRSEMPGSAGRPIVFKGFEYPAWVNSHGATSAVLPGGTRMGVKPGEFEVVEWHGEKGRPTIVCLCGSTRFHDEHRMANYLETMAGRIVLSVGFYHHAQEEVHGETIGCTAEEKVALDRLHLRKIDLAHEILVIDVGGYVGMYTEREIRYAQRWGKPVRWWSDEYATNEEVMSG